MKHLSFKRILIVLIVLLNIKYVSAQRIYASSDATSASGLLCLGCTVTNPGNAADGNLETYAVLNTTVGLAAQTNEDLIFAGAKPAAGTPVTVKLGSGDKLLSLTALGGITLQAFNGSTAIGTPVAVNTLVTALSNNNELEVSITPAQTYDRLRVSLNGGILGALANLYLYEAFYNGPSPVACNTAIDELNGISSGLLGLGANVGGVVNPQQAIDGNINTASTLNAGVGLVGAYAQQTIIYSNPSVIGDSIRITLGVPQTLLTAGVLSNISVATFNGNTSNNDQAALNSSLLNVQLLGLLGGGLQKVTVTFAPAAVFDRVQLTLGGGIANVLSTLNLYEAQRVIPSPVIKINGVVTNNTQICSGGTAVLTANAVPNTIFHWYTAATGGTPIFTGAAFTTPALTATTTYYVAAMRSGCTDESGRTVVTVTVNAIPAAPVITNNTATVCSGQTATFTAQSVANVTVNWYVAATGGTILFTGNSFTTPPIAVTTSYYAEAASGTCTSPTRTQVTVTVSPPPANPTLTAANVTICTGNVAVLTISNPVTGITYNWYSTATGGTPVFTGATFTTPVLTTNTTYYAEASNAGGCTSAQRTTATVTVVASPTDPALTANNTTVTAGQTATIAVTNTQTGITYNWYTSQGAGTPVFTGVTFTTPALFSTTTYYVEAVNSTGCTSINRTPITINVTINTNSPCTYANQQTNTINGLCIGCTITNAALATDADTTTASTINVLAGLTGGAVSQQLQFQQAGFAGDTIKLVLQNPTGLLSASVLGQVQVTLYNGVTQGTTYTLNGSTISVNLLAGTGNKYAVLIPANAAYDRITVTVNSGIVGALSSLNIYYATQLYPKPVFNPEAPEICNGSTAQLNITSPANGTFNWFTSPTGGASVHTGANFTTPALTANTTYYVEYSRGSCVSPNRYPIQVLVDPVPAAPVVNTQNVTITSGQTATLNATASNGATIQWFSAATGGTPLFTGATFTTPALTANTTYYAGTATGSCVSATRTPAMVTVNPIVIPDVTVTPPNVTVGPGQSTSFTASSTTAGAVFNWYTTPTGGTSIFTGATFTTPAEFANTVYYAEASIPATGAVSATRATATVTVNQLAANPVPCDAAIDQTNTTSGLLCVGCSINNATGAVDNDRNTFSQLNVPVGLVNAYSSQTLRFANTGIAGDSVIVELGIPGALASVGVLSQISLATYNGATYNNDRFNVNGSLLNVQLLSGTSRFRIAFLASAPFDRIEIRLNGSVAGVLNTLNVYDASMEVAPPVITTPALTICQGNQATITATASADATIKWYTAASGGTPIFTGATFTTPALNATTTYYAEASRTADGCTQAVRTPAIVTVSPTPAAPVVAIPNVTVCSGSTASFSVTPVTGVTYNWFTAPAGGTALFTGNTFTSPALTANTTYYVETENNGQCSSSARTTVTATVTATPADAVITPASAQICAGSSTSFTASNGQSGTVFNWYDAATGENLVFTGATFNTPALTTTTSYYVQATNGTCVSADRVQATVTVNPLPANPTVVVVPANSQVTSGQTAQITASSTTPNVVFNWYTAASGGTPIFTGAAFTTPALTNTTTYYVEAASATGCTSPARTAVTITVNPVFSTSCDFASTQTTDINNSLLCVLCSVTNPNNAVDADTTSFSQLNLPVGVVGYVGQTLIFGDTGNAGDTVRVKIAVPASLATVGVLNQLQIASYNGGVYNGDRVNLSSSTISIQLLPGNQSAIIKFVPSATFNAVEVRINSTASVLNSVDIYYASKQVPAPQVAIKTANICQGGTATFAVTNPKANVTYKWYSAAVGGTLLFTGTTFTTSALNATTTFYVESDRTSNGCANPNRVAVTANVTPGPANPVLAQNSVQICAGDQVTLSVTNAGTNTINWYDAPTGGTLLFTGPSFSVSPIATINYYAESTNGTCVSPARTLATVTVNPRPAAPSVQSNNVQVCAGSPAVLQVLNPVTGINYGWFTAATGGTAVFTGATFTTPANTINTIYYVQATDAVSGCTNNGGRTQVNIWVYSTVAPPVLSATTTQVCNGGSATLSVDNPVNGQTYTWFTQATGGTPVFTGTTFTVNNFTANVSYFVEAANSAGCPSATRTETDITVQPIPTAPQVQAGSLNVCSGTTASLSIVNPQVNFVYRWYDAATGGTLLYTGTQFNTSALTANTTYYVEAAQAGNCNASTRTQVTVTVNALPTDPVLVSANVSVCSGSPATFTISTPQTGVSYKWYDSPAQTNLLFTGTTFVTPALTTNTTYYVSGTNASGCTSTNLATAQATILAPPSAPTVANGGTVQLCSGSPVVLTISNPQTGFTYNWYDAATGGTLLFTGTSFTTPALTANTTYYAEAVSSTGCISATRTPVLININTVPVNPVVTAQGGGSTTICQGSTITLVATSTTPNVTFNWYDAATGGNLVFTGASFTTPALTTDVTYYVDATNNAGGCISAARTSVPVTVNPLPANPTLVNANVSVCSGATATFSVSTPIAGVTYQWFDSAAKTNLLFTGTTFVTPALTADATYFVNALSASGCSATSLTTATATVIPLPTAPTVANGSTVQLCSGSTVVLTIANPQTGFTYNWYDAATNGTLLFTGTSFTTPALTANTTYYAEAVNSNGCISATRTPVLININTVPVNPVVTAQGGGSTTICQGSTITLVATSTTPNVTFNWYDAATGGNLVFTGTSFTTPALTTDITYYVDATNNAGGCISAARTSVPVTVNPLPANPVLTSANISVCSGSTATFSVSAPVAGVTYQWFDSAAKTNLLFTGTTFVTPALTADATYFVNALSASGCSATSLITATAIVNPLPTAPTVANGSTVQLCSGSTVVLTIANPQTGFTYNWYDAATGGTLLFTGTSFTTPALTVNTTYYAEAVSSTGCISATRTPVSININTVPANPVVTAQGGGSTTICQGSTITLVATSTTPNVTFNWYDAATGGNLVFTGASFTTPALNADVTYYVDAINNAGGCISATRTSVPVTVNPLPANPVLTNANVSVCSGATATFSVSTPVAGVTYQWFDSAAKTNLLFTGTTFVTPALTADATYYINAVSASGCSATSLTTATATVNPLPSAPAITNGNTVQLCSGSPVVLTIANPQTGFTYNWYDAATGGTLLFTGTSFTTPALTANTTYYAEAVSSTGCISSTRTPVLININTVPVSPIVTAQGGGSTTICQGSTITLVATSTTPNVTFNWYDAATGGNLVFTGASFTTPALNADVTYYVDATNNAGGCISAARTSVPVTVNPLPANPVLTNANVSVCSGATATFSVSTPVAGVTYQWFDSAAKTNLLFTGTTFVTPALNANTTYYVAATSAAGCTSTSLTTAVATVIALPSAPAIANGNTAQTCAGSTATVNISTPQTGFTYNWYNAATGGTLLFTGTSFTTPALTANTTYYADAVNSNGCISTSRTPVTINVNPVPASPTITAQGGGGTAVCQGNTITLTATSTTPNVTFNWYTAATGGTPIFTGTAFTTPVITTAITYYAEAVGITGGCVSATRTPVQITINNSMATQPTVNAADLSVCQNNVATIHISSPDAATTYSWFTVATGGTPVYTGTVYNTPALTANTTYYVEASNAQSCNPSARLVVNVIVIPQPATPVLTAANTAVCNGSSAILSIQSPIQGVTYKWYDSPAMTNLLFTGPTFTTAPITANTMFYVNAANGSCSASALATAQVTITTPPAAPTLVNSNLQTCNGTQVSLSIANPQSGYTYNWYSAITGGTPVFTGTIFTPNAVSTDITYYAEAVSNSGCTSASRTAATITIIPSPPPPGVTAAADICPGTSAVLASTNTNAAIAITWYANATGGTALFSGNSFTTPALTANTTYYAEAANSGGCVSATRTPVTVKIIQQLAAPVVTVASTTPTSVTFNWDGVPNATGYQVSKDNGANFTDVTGGVSALTYTVSNLLPDQSATVIIKALGATACQTSDNSAAVTGRASNPNGNAVFVPNAFTPNGDGKNDVFLVYGNTIKTVSMWVYDQWGEMIFTSNSINNGWDGTYKNHPQPVGVYVYYLEAVLNDGSIVKKKGTIDLLR